MSSDPNDRPDVPESQTEPSLPAEQDAKSSSPLDPAQERRRILIGSQRDPAAYRPKPKRDWLPVSGKVKPKIPPAKPSPPVAEKVAEKPVAEVPAPEIVAPASPVAIAPPAAVEEPAPIAVPQPPVPQPPAVQEQPVVTEAPPVAVPAPSQPVSEQPATAPPVSEQPSSGLPERCREQRGRGKSDRGRGRPSPDEEELLGPIAKKFPPPNIRERLPQDLEQELEDAMGDVSIEAMMADGESVSTQPVLEAESRYTARVVAVHRDDVFVELGGREQGIISARLFAEPPQPGATLEVVLVRFHAADGLYELTLPNVAASVGDWSQINEGMLVEAKVTGHNAGGLECEVNHIRAFIPISQIAIYRVEDLSEFVDQKFTCMVTEANPARKNLVLSRRAILEREKEEARAAMFETLAPGQIFEGVVRKIMDFGAFVELGNGVDGLLHISQLGWARVKHPSEVVREGQRIRVRIDKIDKETGKIGLGYKELTESPWATADQKYPTNTPVHGKVVKIMEFGAFVELEPGVEGLVHISELSHKRVARVSEVVKEGDEVDVMVLSVDKQAQRISLSMKSLSKLAEPEFTPEPKVEEEPLLPPKPKKPTGPLKGGLGKATGGDSFGLKW